MARLRLLAPLLVLMVSGCLDQAAPLSDDYNGVSCWHSLRPDKNLKPGAPVTVVGEFRVANQALAEAVESFTLYLGGVADHGPHRSDNPPMDDTLHGSIEITTTWNGTKGIAWAYVNDELCDVQWWDSTGSPWNTKASPSPLAIAGILLALAAAGVASGRQRP